MDFIHEIDGMIYQWDIPSMDNPPIHGEEGSTSGMHHIALNKSKLSPILSKVW